MSSTNSHASTTTHLATLEATPFTSDTLSGTVYCADAIDLLRHIGPHSADILFIDPPFNLGKTYSPKHDLDRKTPAEYHAWLTEIVDLSIETLKPGAALFLYHMPEWALRIGAHIAPSLSFRHWISVSMKNSFARGKKLYPAHYALLYFTAGPPNHFFRPKTEPLRCRSCGELVRDYGGYRKHIEDKGVNLTDIWDDLSPVRHRSRKHRSANELPMALFERIIAISGAPGLTYVDPFAGSGSGALAAFNKDMNFIVGDVLRENTQIIVSRLTERQETS